jgi:outer membrane protein OmpA-like peptidoglycan-associated protein
MSFRTAAPLSRLAVFALLAATLLFTATAAAQEKNAPKAEIFVGYAWMDPGDFSGNEIGGIEKGWGSSVTLNGNNIFGLTFDFGGHYDDQVDFGTIMVGPKLTWRGERVSVFGEALAGISRMSVDTLGSDTGFGGAVGGGIDLNLTDRFSWRLLQADLMYLHHNFGPALRDSMNGPRLRTGLVINLGIEPPGPPPSATCSAEPSEVMAGEPVKVTANAQNFNPKRTLSYTWNATGGKVSGNEATVNVDTTGLAPGSYNVSTNISDNKKGAAQCSASFTVKEPPKNPPQISCSANPTTVQSGDPSTISCNCTSPDGRPVQISYSTSGGQIAGTGNTAQLDTAGAPAGQITVSATCTDDRNLSAQGSASVNVEVPPPPPQAEKLNEIMFKKNNARVDNAAKAILDDVALRLQRDADAKAVIIGNADPGERNGKRLAAQRARNTRAYLVDEKGIDPSRIELRTGSGGAMTAEIHLVPAGATFEGAGTEVVTEPAPR